jgi:hypothetical protein
VRHDTTKNEERSYHDPPWDRRKGYGRSRGLIGAGRKEAACLVGSYGRGLRKEAETHGVRSERCAREEDEDRLQWCRRCETYIRRVPFE